MHIFYSVVKNTFFSQSVSTLVGNILWVKYHYQQVPHISVYFAKYAFDAPRDLPGWERDPGCGEIAFTRVCRFLINCVHSPTTHINSDHPGPM